MVGFALKVLDSITQLVESKSLGSEVGLGCLHGCFERIEGGTQLVQRAVNTVYLGSECGQLLSGNILFGYCLFTIGNGL